MFRPAELRSWLLAGALFCMAFALAACGADGDGDDSAVLPEPPQLEGVETPVQVAIEAAAAAARMDSGASLRRYAQVLQAHSFDAEAAEIYLLAAKKTEDAWRDLYLAGRALVTVDPVASRRNFERSRTLNPKYATTHLWLGRLYLDENDLDAALKSYETANQIQASPFAHVGAARVYMSEGERRDLRKAKAHLDQARSLGRRKPDVYIEFARYYRLTGKGRQRLAAERLARDEVPRFGFPDPLMREVALLSVSREGLRRQVEGLVNIGDFELALARAETFLSKHDDKDAALHFKANVLLRLARHEEVLTIVDDLLERHPEDQDLMVLRANSLHDLGRVNEAVAQLEASVKLGEAHVPTRYTLGTLLGPIDAVAARGHLEWVLEMAPLRHPETRLLLSRIYEVLGQKSKAVQILKDALAFDPTDENARRRLGEVGG
jgi:tetratricopeptide (TPR) repeat protein